MLLTSILLQRRARWRFPGTADLHRWANDGPWYAGGGLAFLGGCGSQSNELVAAAVQAVRSYVNGPLVSVATVVADSGRPILGSVATSLGLSGDLTPYELRRLIAEYLERQPMLFIAEVTTAKQVGDLYQLYEYCTKQAPPVAFACLAWSKTSFPAPDDVLSVEVRGGSCDEPLEQLWNAHTERDAFASFLFARVIWEAGGDYGITVQMEKMMAEMVDPSSSDHLIDKAISQACTEIPTPDPIVISALQKYLAGSSERSLTDGQAEELAAEGLLWKPEWGSGWMVPPWLTRRLYSIPPLNRKGWLVRRFMQCMPLASAISARCLHLELIARERMIPHLGECPIPIAAQHIKEWRERADWDRINVYPPTYPFTPSRRPAVPDGDVWLWSDLGDLATTANTRGFEPFGTNTLFRLARIRNAIVHCHPPAWAHINALRAIGDIVQSGYQ